MSTSSTTSPGLIAILIVDDDEDCRLLIRDAICQCGVDSSVFEAADGNEAIEFLYRRGRWADAPRPGLIYLDIEMPGPSGQEVLKVIKTDPNLRDIPVVMITGVSDERQMRQAAESGANSYTLKPVSAERFLQTILTSAHYWLTIHQYPNHHWPPQWCRR